MAQDSTSEAIDDPVTSVVIPCKKNVETDTSDINTSGATDYGMTTRQRRKVERTSFTQKDRNLHKRRMKQEKRQKVYQERLHHLRAMSEEEKMQHRNANIKKREQKRKIKEITMKKIEEASINGLKICIDLGFNKLYKKDMEYTNILKQLCYCWNANKNATEPVNRAVALHLLNVDQNWMKHFESQGILRWKGVHLHHSDIMETFGDAAKSKITYLTPDSDHILNVEEFREQIENGTERIYVLGGIADRVIRKDLTLDRAKDLGIGHCKLPLHLLPDITGRRCLNVDTVFRILLRMQDPEQNIVDILDEEVPKRNRKTTKSRDQRRRSIKGKEESKNIGDAVHCHWREDEEEEKGDETKDEIKDEMKDNKNDNHNGKNCNDKKEEKETFVYEWSGKKTLQIHQDPTGIWVGGIGATVWDAGIVMAKYLEAMASEVVTGRSIMEIGSGTGLCGMVAGTLSPQVVVLTDKNCAIPLLEKNLFENFYKLYPVGKILNGDDDEKGQDDNVKPPLMLSHALTWGEEKQIDALCAFLKKHCGSFESMIDYILISDCICWKELHKPLIETLDALVTFIAQNNSNGKVPTILMSYEIRKDEEEQGFFKSIGERDWKYNKVELKEIKGFDAMYICPELPLYTIHPCLKLASED